MKTLLVAVDFSESNQIILDAVVPMARALNAQVHLLHAFWPRPGIVGYEAYVYPGPDVLEEQLREEKAMLREMVKNLEAKALINVTGAIEEGEPVSTILKHAAERNADLIVVGSHHHGFLHRVFLGSTADKVLRKADRPILVIPSD